MKLRLPPLALLAVPALLAAAVPAGFTPLFNGKDLTGWHISQVNHHGNSKGWSVKDGVVLATQDRPGNGGILLTDRKYRDFEVSLEMNPTWGCDGGLFLRSNEEGDGYQVMIDYLEGGSVGGVYGEGLGGQTFAKSGPWADHWKKDEWNTLRARIEGDVPHIRVWLNEFPARRLDGHQEPREERRDRGHDRAADALLGREDAALEGRRLPEVPERGGEGAAALSGGRACASASSPARSSSASCATSPRARRARWTWSSCRRASTTRAARSMRERLQSAIDATDPAKHDAVALAYGLCNNGLVGLRGAGPAARPAPRPRLHHGVSRQPGALRPVLRRAAGHVLRDDGLARARRRTAGPTACPSQTGTLGFDLATLAEKYGEDNARYILETMTRHYRRLAFIRMGVEPDGSFEERTRELADGARLGVRGPRRGPRPSAPTGGRAVGRGRLPRAAAGRAGRGDARVRGDREGARHPRKRKSRGPPLRRETAARARSVGRGEGVT